MYDTFYNGDIYQDNARQNTSLTVRLCILSSIHSIITTITIHDNIQCLQLDLKIVSSFLDVSVWSTRGNTVRRCRCRRVGFETNSSSIAVRWRWRNDGDTFPVCNLMFTRQLICKYSTITKQIKWLFHNIVVTTTRFVIVLH